MQRIQADKAKAGIGADEQQGAGARLLGVERSRLVGRRFGLCVSEADRPAFDALLKTAFESTATAACEVAILKEGTSPLVVRIEAAAPEDGRECRAVVADITERKRAEDAMEILRNELESRVQERTAELARTNDQLRIFASELTLAEEHERRRLAVELHDGLDQNLSLAEMKLGELLKSPQATGLNRPLREIKQLIVQANRQARSLTFQLSPAVLYDIGLSAALEWLAEQMQLRHGIKITLEDDEQVRSIQIEPRILLFRALRDGGYQGFLALEPHLVVAGRSETLVGSVRNAGRRKGSPRSPCQTWTCSSARMSTASIRSCARSR